MEMVKSTGLKYGLDLDVTKFIGGHMFNLNPKEGNEKVDEASVWNYYKKDGCTIRLLKPQVHAYDLYRILSALEPIFG